LSKECEICGKFRTITWAPFNFDKTKVDQHNITAEPLNKFVEWLLYEQNSKYKTIAFAHYGGRYDVTFLFGEIIRNVICPDLIKQGNRLYEMKISRGQKNPEIVFRDSFNYISQKLDNLVKAFDLPVKSKPFFPHLYNKSENYNTIIPHLPPKNDYLYKSKKPEEKKAFDIWYDANYNQPYNFNEVMAEYAVNDVEILTHALVALQKTFFSVSKREGLHKGIDILYECITIASACMKNFRLNHLKTGQLAVVPEKGYDRMQNQSEIAIKFLTWYEKQHNVKLRTALSDNGEKKIGPYSLDGYIEETHTGIEIHGCYFHGCEKCFPDDQIILADGKTAGIIRQRDKERLAILRMQLEIKVYWCCEIDEMLKQSKEMKEFFDTCTINTPIKERDCYFGG
jgi:hypothetical protein